MNTILMQQIVNRIKAQPKLFNMNTFAQPTECGTVHCIAGWACAITNERLEQPIENWYDIRARELLGLSSDIAHNLFFGHWPDRYLSPDYDGLSTITVGQAVKILEDLISGELDVRELG